MNVSLHAVCDGLIRSLSVGGSLMWSVTANGAFAARLAPGRPSQAESDVGLGAMV